MFEQHTSQYIKPKLDLPNYKYSVLCQRISQLHRKHDPNIMYQWRFCYVLITFLSPVWMTILLCINNFILIHLSMTILLCINNFSKSRINDNFVMY